MNSAHGTSVRGEVSNHNGCILSLFTILYIRANGIEEFVMLIGNQYKVSTT